MKEVFLRRGVKKLRVQRPAVVTLVSWPGVCVSMERWMEREMGMRTKGGESAPLFVIFGVTKHLLRQSVLV